MEPKSRWNRFIIWLCDLKASDVMMVILTFVIAGTGVVGIILVIQGGEDTKRIIKASEDQATAAEDFAKTAANINTKMDEAVGKLNLQAGELEKSAEQTARLAKAAEDANTNAATTLEVQTRPWVSVDKDVLNDQHDTHDLRGHGGGNSKLWTHFRIRIWNYGHYPAQNVKAWFFPTSMNAPDFTDQMLDEACRNADGPNGMELVPEPIFPNVPKDVLAPVVIGTHFGGCISYIGTRDTGAPYHTQIVYTISYLFGTRDHPSVMATGAEVTLERMHAK